MARQLLSFAVALCLLAVVPATDADAVDLPIRKAGLWEMKMVRTGGSIPDMTMQHCTDASTDKLKWEVYEDDKKESRWRLHASNGQVIASSSQGYKSKEDCDHAIDVIKSGAKNAEVTEEGA